jgi:hypothetical protein
MIEQTGLPKKIDAARLLRQSTAAPTSQLLQSILAELPIVNEHEYRFDRREPGRDWKEGHFHWYPVGGERGNAGRIKLASRPINPIAERTINAMEAIIELHRQREIARKPQLNAPGSPREAVMRYFELPPLDQLPKMATRAAARSPREQARAVARFIRVQLQWDKKLREFTVSIEDDGIGQAPAQVHETLLSLGSSNKADKRYLIGVFGQGGSSAFAASEFSCVVSRRAPDLLNGDADGVGWTIVKHVFPKGRRDDYFAYLAAHPDGRVPTLPVAAAEETGLRHGSRFVHVGYNFGQGGAAITRNFYQALNHVLFNPILPFDLNVGGTLATIYGNGYRLSNLKAEDKDLDKVFDPQQVEA